MKVTTPADKAPRISHLDKAVIDFEEQFIKQDPGENYYHLVIVGELSRPTCNEVEKIYMEAGWSKAICKTSSENGERGGLTGLRLYR